MQHGFFNQLWPVHTCEVDPRSHPHFHEQSWLTAREILEVKFITKNIVIDKRIFLYLWRISEFTYVYHSCVSNILYILNQQFFSVLSTYFITLVHETILFCCASIILQTLWYIIQEVYIKLLVALIQKHSMNTGYRISVG